MEAAFRGFLADREITAVAVGHDVSRLAVDAKATNPSLFVGVGRAPHIEAREAERVVHLDGHGATRGVIEHPGVVAVVVMRIVRDAAPPFTDAAEATAKARGNLK